MGIIDDETWRLYSRFYQEARAFLNSIKGKPDETQRMQIDLIWKPTEKAFGGFLHGYTEFD